MEPALGTYTPLDLFRLAHSDPAVARHLAAWASGAFVEFEDMLISLVCTLADQKADHREHVRRMALGKPR